MGVVGELELTCKFSAAMLHHFLQCLQAELSEQALQCLQAELSEQVLQFHEDTKEGFWKTRFLQHSSLVDMVIADSV